MTLLTDFRNSFSEDFQGNRPSSYDSDLHLTLTMLLHYLMKSENSKQLCF